jgi:hypothetical protein
MARTVTDPRKTVFPAKFKWFYESFDEVMIRFATKCPGVIDPLDLSFRTLYVDTRFKHGTAEIMRSLSFNIGVFNLGKKSASCIYLTDDGIGFKMPWDDKFHQLFLPFESIISISSSEDINDTNKEAYAMHYGQEMFSRDYGVI